MTITVAGSAPSSTGQVFLAGAALVFAVRWVVELVAVQRVVGDGSPLFGVLHRLAIIAWALIAAVYVAALLRA